MNSDRSSTRVSVVIPCYNREDLIAEAIESALDQTGAEIEVVVVDDGSTDNSWLKILSYGSRVTAISSENCGVSNARNLGVAAATGNWVKFLDSDDCLLPGAIAQQLEQVSRLPDQCLPVGALALSNMPTPDQALLDDIGTEITPMKLGSESIQVSQPLLPKSAIQRCGGFRKSTISEDYELMIRIALLGWKFYVFHNPVVFFRDHDDPERLSKNLTEARFGELSAVYARLFETISASDHPNIQAFRSGVAQSAWSMGRRAARLKLVPQAMDLFRLAETAGGRHIRKAKFPLSCLYRLLDPVKVEQCSEFFKELAGGRRS
jgi:glycosyltransferase involved in cell wall biosynthesis